jgi:hypothetical protein
MADEDIDTSDIPELGGGDFLNVPNCARRPSKP